MAVSTLSIGLIAALLVGGGLGLPLGLPPLPPDPIILRAAPEKCLFYMSWAGTAKPDPKSGNQTEQLLAEDEVIDFLQQTDKQIEKAIRQAVRGKGDAEALADVGPALVKTLLTRPTALYVKDFRPRDTLDASGALVVNCGDQANQVRLDLMKLEALLLKNAADGNVKELTISDVAFRELSTVKDAPIVRWGMMKEYLLVTVGAQTARDLLARLSTPGKPPAWLATLQKQLPVDRVSVISYCDVAAVLETAQPVMNDPKVWAALRASGVADIKSFSSVTGLDSQAIVSRTLLSLDGEPQGLLAAVAAKPLSASDLAGIPQDCTLALVARVDLADLYDRLLAAAGQIDPRAAERLNVELQKLTGDLGFAIKDDLIDSLGDVMKIYNSSGDGSWALTSLVATVGARDRPKLTAIEEKMLKRIRARLAAEPKPGFFELKETTYRGRTIHYLEPLQPLPISLSWCLTDDQLLLALNFQSLKSALARPVQLPGLAEQPVVAERLEAGPAMFGYLDMRPAIKALYPMIQTYTRFFTQQLARNQIEFELPPLPAMEVVLPHLTPTTARVRRTDGGILNERWLSAPWGGNEMTTAPLAVALLLPAVQKAREAARRTQQANNLKQVGLALLNHHDTFKKFPAAATVDKSSKPLLSWRVKLLPFLDETQLYNEFHRDEPWDSEHNRKLIERMPTTYADPDQPELAKQGKTRVLVPVGDHTIFRGNQGVALKTVIDGTSNTILAVEATSARAVIWTKPDDLQLDLREPLAGLKGARTNGFYALFADGSVQFLSDSIDPKVLGALFTPSGREAEGVRP